MKYLSITLLLTGVLLGMTSCNDFLDETPRNSLSPESYFYEETQLLSYVDDIYRKEGDPEGKDAARELKARMIMCGNTDSDSIYYFEKYARYTWSDL